MRVPVYKPLIENSDIEAVSSILEEAWLGHGKYVKDFENQISKFINNSNRKVVAVSTGTSAAHLGLLAAGIGPGDEVILSSLNFVGVAQSITATGAKPVFCDVDNGNLTLNLDECQKLVNKRTKAIITLDYGGNQCDLDKFLQLGIDKNIRIVHDAAHSFGWTYKDKPTGSFGDMCFFSFDPVKNFTAIDAGVVVTSNPEEEKWLIEARTVGQSLDMGTYGKNVKMEFKQIEHIGYRYHLSNVHAVLGMNQLNKFDRISKSRMETSIRYNEAFEKIDDVQPIGKSYEGIIPFIYVVRVKNEKREELRAFLSEQGIETHVHWAPIHWYKFYNNNVLDLPVSNLAGQEVLTLPLHSCMKEEDSEYVIEKVSSFFK